MGVDAALIRLRRWAAECDDVRALAVVGSFASGTAGPGSDVDVILLTIEPERYTATDAWVSALGLGPLVRSRRWGAITERRLALAPGVELELGIGGLGWATTDPVDPGTRRVVAGGMTILHDPDGVLAALRDSVLGSDR